LIQHIPGHSKKRAIITGITGQDAAYLSKLLLAKDYQLIGVCRKGGQPDLTRLAYLGILDNIQLVECDLVNQGDCMDLIAKYQPDEVYNLAAQSSVSSSFQFPRVTIEFNIISVLNLLEAIRMKSCHSRFYQASSSEMYGIVNQLPITIQSVLHPVSPYGISKAAGHWLVSQYRESYNLFAVSGILFNHESFLRQDSFFVKKVITSAIRIRNGQQHDLHVGSIDIKRDFGSAKDYVEAIWLMLQNVKPIDYLVCTGSSVSLRDIIHYVFDQLGIDRKSIITDSNLVRPSEISDIYGDPSPIYKDLQWKGSGDFYKVLDELISEEMMNYGN